MTETPVEQTCTVCGTTEGLIRQYFQSLSGPGWERWYCEICIALPPVHSDGVDQLLAAADGRWTPGEPWPPRP